MVNSPTADFNTVQLRGKFVGLDAVPVVGSLTFTPRATRLVDAGVLTIIIGRTLSVNLNSSGAFTISLPATNDPDIGITFSYLVVENFPGGDSYDIAVPISAEALGLDLATVPRTPAIAVITPSGGVDASLYVSKASFDALADVARSGAYLDLLGRPTLSTVSRTGLYADILSKPALAVVATSGSYLDLASKPTLSTVSRTGVYADLLSKPTLSTVATTGAYADLTGEPTLATVATTGAYADLTGAPTGGGGGGVVSVGTEVLFSTLTGATDDIKLTSFMTTQAAATYKGKTLVLDEARAYTFATTHNLYSGFSIRGAARPQDQARSGLPVAQVINCNASGGVFALATTPVFGCSFANLTLQGSSTSRLIAGTEATGRILWTTIFRDISSQNIGGILGSAGNKLLLTACVFDGAWNVNNVVDVAFNIGGSDLQMSFSQMLIDTDPTMSGPMPVGNYLMRMNGIENTVVRNLYMTSEQHSGIYFDGGSTSYSTFLRDSVLEGRNATQACYGSLVKIGNGQVSIKDSRLGFAMSSPSSQVGHTDAGVIHMSGGTLLLDGCTYERGYTNGTSTLIAETVPLLYVSGGKARVRNIMPSGTWTGLPVVRQLTTGLIDADNSVTVVTG